MGTQPRLDERGDMPGQVGTRREALRIDEKILLLDLDLDLTGEVSTDLRNIFVDQTDLGRLYDAHRVWALLEKVAPLTGDKDQEAMVYLRGLELATRRGDFGRLNGARPSSRLCRVQVGGRHTGPVNLSTIWHRSCSAQATSTSARWRRRRPREDRQRPSEIRDLHWSAR